MRKLLLIYTIFIFLSFAQIVSAKSFSLLISLKYDQDKEIFSSSKVELAEGEAATHLYQPKDGHLLKIISGDKTTLYSTKFLIPRGPAGTPPNPEWFNEKGEQVYIPKPDEPTGLPSFKDMPFDIVTPYFIKSKNIEIYDPQNKLVLNLEVPRTSELIDKFVDEQLTLREEASKTSVGEKLFLGGSLIGLLILLGLIFFYFHKKLTV